MNKVYLTLASRIREELSEINFHSYLCRLRRYEG